MMDDLSLLLLQCILSSGQDEQGVQTDSRQIGRYRCISLLNIVNSPPNVHRHAVRKRSVRQTDRQTDRLSVSIILASNFFDTQEPR